MRTDLFLPAGSAGDGPDPVHLTPEAAGWDYAGLRVLALSPGEQRVVRLDGVEAAVVPLSGSCRVEVGGRSFNLAGRRDVFSRVTDIAYLPLGSEVRLTSPTGGELALPTARATRRFEPAYLPAEAVPVEVRGSGPATRQVNNLLGADVLEADKLIAVEVLTPAGNWSSYPPHKHDELSECEVPLEEIYYFRIQGESGFGLHRTYTTDGEIEVTVTVRDGDVFLVPRGYHGPCVAAPGYHMHYLNVMAGPGEERVWRFCTDPAHVWVLDALAAAGPDPRCPHPTALGLRPEAHTG
ncbi:MAG: 5-deoxy-glucuronate isomerase [Acidimicrobiia bacterium]